MLKELSRSGFAVLLGLAVIVPLLNYYRTSPSPTLYSEAAAGLFFLAAVALTGPILPTSQRVHLSFFVFTFGLLGVLAYQLLSGRYFQFALSWATWAAYLVVFLVATVLGQLASGAAALRTLIADRLTHAFLLAALFNAVAQTAQATGWASQIEPLVFVPGAAELAGYVCSPAGNVAQRNHANALAWLGISSLLYLFATRRAGASMTVIGLGILLLSSAFTSSRMAWLMLLAVCGLIFQGRSVFGWSMHRASSISAGLILGLLAATTAKRLITGPGCVTALDRVLGSGEALDYWVRIELMRQALMVWWSQPILGVGVGKFMAATFALEPERKLIQPLDFYVHNTPLEILASFGLVGGGLLLFCGLLWMARAWRERTSSLQQWPMLAGVIVLSIHALLEMPLWYLYFIIPFGLMLGIVVGGVRVNERAISLPWNVFFLGVALFGMPSLFYAVVDHARAERILWLAKLAVDEPTLAGSAVSAIQSDVQNLRIFAIAGERELLRFADLNRANAPGLAAVNRRLLENIPDPVTIARQVMLEAFAGRHEEARDLFRRLMMFFPRQAETLAPEIQRRAAEQSEEIGFLVKIIDEELARPPKSRG